MNVPPEMLDLARRLLRHEAVEGCQPPECPELRVSEKLRQSLSALVGVVGFRTLLARALTLAKAEAPILGTLKISNDGSLEGFPSAREAPLGAAQIDGAGAVLVGHLLALLCIFIGESLTLRLVQDVWPEVALGDHDRENWRNGRNGRKDEPSR